MIAPDDERTFLRSLRVLHVEDDHIFREVTAVLLEGKVGELIQAGDGLEGLAQFQTTPVDLVVTDILMPRMDGLDMAAEIRSLAPEVPILVTTAFEKSDYLLRAIDLGIDHYVLKPVVPERLEAGLLRCARRLQADRLIERQRKLEQEAERLRHQETLSILSQGLAHDFNDLLQTILSWVSVARRSAEPGGKVAEALNRVEHSSRQAQELSERLRLLGSGEQSLESLGPIEGLVRTAVGEALLDSHVEAVFEEGAQGVAVRHSEAHLGQLVEHLVRNAREAMGDRGRLRIASTVEALPEGNLAALPAGRYLSLAFEDQGPGIDTARLSRIFDPYFTTKRPFNLKGQGLGLALCQAIARHHGGALTVQSVVRQGSTFRLYLPLDDA